MAGDDPVRGPSRRIAEIAVVAAAYAAITLYVPVSYGALQARLAETLKPLVIWEPQLIPAFVLGNFLGNLGSPWPRQWELIWMPFANLVGAWLCWRVGRLNAYLGAAAYAVVTAAAVTTMLSVVLHAPFLAVGGPILASELALIVLGVPLMRPVHVALRRIAGGRAEDARAR